MMNRIVRIDFESEGDQNGYADVHYEDGSVGNYNSCGQGSFEEEDGTKIDSELNGLLFDLWGLMDCDDYDDPDYYELRFGSSFHPGPKYWEQDYLIRFRA